MTEELKKHLVKVEAAIQAVKPILGRHGYTDDYRTVVVIGFISQAIEHQEAVLLLTMRGLVGSAFALARPIVEIMFRGLWINQAASDAEVEQFVTNDEIRLTVRELAATIDASYHAEGFFQNLKARSWDALNGYTHTGMIQLGRRFTEHEAKPSYTEAQIFEITTAVTTCVLMLTSKFLEKRTHVDDAHEIEALIETYGPASEKGAVKTP